MYPNYFHFPYIHVSELANSANSAFIVNFTTSTYDFFNNGWTSICRIFPYDNQGMHLSALWTHLDSEEQGASKGVPKEDLPFSLLGRTAEAKA